MSNSSRKPFPQFNSFRPFVVDELQRRKNTEIPTPIVAPFLRLTSCMEDDVVDYAFFSLGLHGYDKPDGANIFDLTYGSDKEVVGYAYSRNKDAATGKHNKRLINADDISPNVGTYSDVKNGVSRDQSTTLINKNTADFMKKVVPDAAHPIPGITNASVVRRGLGQPLVATVNWQCYNQGQLEFLRNHFLCTGNYVILEFGNQFSDKQINKVIDYQTDQSKTFELLQKVIGATEASGTVNLNGRKLVIDDYNTPNDGNYDFIVGQVSNFEITIDPNTGIYKCMTKIVSQGENVWGITIDKTFVTNDESSDSKSITTIRNYFEKKYYEFIQHSLESNTPGVYQKLGKAWKDGKLSVAETVDKADAVEQNPNDFAFVTWDFLMNNLFSSILDVIQDESVKKELKQYMKFYKILDDDFIGYHQNLLSSDPNTLLIVSQGLNKNITIDSGLTSNGKFGPDSTTGSDQSSGKLNKGIWINTGAIRECFMSSGDLRQAISVLLSRMNAAVGGYWQLQLFWDDELSIYRVIDYKYGSQYRDMKFYKFNVGGAGECLEIEFDSAFPPELVTQMNLVAMLQTKTAEEQAQYITKYPLLGTTSAHMFMLNWTHLKDGLRSRINQWRNTSNKTLQTSAAELGGREVSMTLIRVSQVEGTGLTPSVLGTSTRAVGEQLDSTTAQLNSPDNTTIGPVRSSVATPSKYTNEQLRVLSGHVFPINGNFPISSKFGMRSTGMHKGIDIDTPVGTPVYASISGVANVSDDPDGFGTYVKIRTPQKVDTLYAHLSRISVSSGNQISAGQLIGYTGGLPGALGSGNSRGPHLHYEVRVDGDPIDPQNIPTESRVTSSPVQPSTTHPLDNTSTIVTSSPATPTSNDSQLKKEESDARRKEVTEKFGDSISSIIANNLGDMINSITKSGYANPSLPNQFVAPYPTTTKITVEIQGISGISVSDGFFVDKIPFLFERHGVFQVTETIDSITNKGWRTGVSGYFKMLWYDGNPGIDSVIR